MGLIEKTNVEAECPKCMALIYIGEMEEYEMVTCHECDENLELVDGVLVRAE